MTNPLPKHPVPPWIADLLAKAAKPELPDAYPDETEENVEQAVLYLDTAAPCIQGDGGNDRLFKVAAHVRELGVSYETALEIMEDFNGRCVPPWEAEEFAKVVANAYEYAQNAIGSKSLEAKLDAADRDFGPKLLPLRNSSDIVDEDIPKRDWIIKDFILTGFLSLLVSPGGIGKSNLEMIKAIAVKTGLPLLGEEHPVIKRGNVVIYNCEDPLEEMERRMAACRRAYGLSREDTDGIYLVSGRDHRLRVAGVNRVGEIVINAAAVELLVDTLKSVDAILLSVDPLVKTHGANENSNDAMDVVTMAYGDISQSAKCAVSIVHHTNKSALRAEGESDNQSLARGAGSVSASVRVQCNLTRMTEAEAKQLSVPVEKRKRYFKHESSKANFTAPAEFADWFENLGIVLPNSDDVGVAKRVNLVAQVRVAEQFEAEERKKSLLEFLEAKVPDKIPLKEFNRLARQEGQWFATDESHSSRLVETFDQILGGDGDFIVSKSAGKTGPWTVRRSMTNI